MSSRKESDHGFDFLVPVPTAVATRVEPRGTETEASEESGSSSILYHQKGEVVGLFGGDDHQVRVTPEKLEEFWSSQLEPMVGIITGGPGRPRGRGGIRGFEVDQVTIHLGVKAGGLFFVARASAEASIEVVLRRTGSAESAEPPGS